MLISVSRDVGSFFIDWFRWVSRRGTGESCESGGTLRGVAAEIRTGALFVICFYFVMNDGSIRIRMHHMAHKKNEQMSIYIYVYRN